MTDIQPRPSQHIAATCASVTNYSFCITASQRCWG